MANKDNECSHLKIGNQEFPGLELLFSIQQSLQDKICKEKGVIPFKGMNMKQTVEFALANKHAMQDEVNEMIDAIGGIKDGIGSAGWKWWKEANGHTPTMSIEDLSENDRKELLMEYVDVLHFIINFGLLFQFTAKEVGNAYLAKNKENIDRQNRNY